MTPVERLRAAEARLRERAASSADNTLDMPMVQGVWLNHAHYLTTTRGELLAMAAWLAVMALYVDSGNDVPGMRGRGLTEALALADAILGSAG